MLNIDRNNLPRLGEDLLKKQRTTLLIIAFLLLAGGILCLINPFASGAALSIVVGILLLLSGAGLVIGMIANRAQNTWPLIGGILLGVAYLIIGYLFISNPLTGVLALAVYLAVLFAFGGIARLIAGYVRRGQPGNWLQFVIGVLDLIIAWMLVGSGPEASITLVTAIVGIEMLVSSFALFQAASLFKRA
ncbi:HdeD family acid-resistance protein [Serratia entomophila]|uniref:HdeD family acid-resistance protein n=1 Tax=Serratia entomophila TaxID=42906 RepID=UPI002177D240|nr:HdeD family acid-resistance protein [Serratia entomophila]CAI0865655.1 acid-resistance membrane protein [Serratia entomophila]CAI1105281.1 acid-resistance membrane protein [Serratia entomophila]CAI1107582.1 acid-resistance membrane protein [Serratia entomophila]CAI1713488.1 acid-resistance membrane protein [Serratia entomophila]CAI1892372.1 acid-resistance membrane protein [Serratia entomophila]